MKIRLCRRIFVNIYQRGTTCHATSASEARVTCLGSQMHHLTRFRNLNEQFESLGIYMKQRNKFGDLVKQIKAGPNHMGVLLLLEINSYLDQEI